MKGQSLRLTDAAIAVSFPLAFTLAWLALRRYSLNRGACESDDKRSRASERASKQGSGCALRF
jgi:hypothetical protein